MKFRPLPVEGAYHITLEPVRDDRGFNARTWCTREFAEHGITETPVQANIIHNGPAGTVRGFHYQLPPMAEGKLFRVTHGAIHDVVIDIRPGSPTRGQHTSVELRADRYEQLYVPPGCGQGFQTLEEDTELVYQVSSFYSPDHGAGFRYDDPAFAIAWPLAVTAISDKDRAWPAFSWEDVQ
jgi:dTDP-4-dehydrorhamnose 3,5-epimerase